MFELRREGRTVPVQPRVLETIFYMVRSGGRLVTKHDLIAGPWRGQVVGDAAIAQAMMLARRALAGGAGAAPAIVTVRGKGFRFTGPVARRARAGGDGDGRVDGAAVTKGAAPPARLHGLVDQLKRSARRLDDPWRLLEAGLWRAHHLLERGDAAALERQCAEHARLATETRHPGHQWFARVLAATLLFQEARIAEAEGILCRSLPSGIEAVGPRAVEVTAVHLFNLALELRGRRRRAALERVRGMVSRLRDDAPGSLPWRLLSAGVHWQLDDQMGARRFFEEVHDEIPLLGEDRLALPCLVMSIDLLVAFRHEARLPFVYERLGRFDGLHVVYELSDWGPVSFHLGRAARELGDVAAAARHFERAEVEAGAAGSRCWQSWTRYARARLLAGAGRPRIESDPRGASLAAGDARRDPRHDPLADLLRATALSARQLKLEALAQAASSLARPPSPTALLAPKRAHAAA